MRSETPDFSRRAVDLTEWMDEPASYEELRACLRDLEQANRVTLAYRPTLIWLDRLVRARRLQSLRVLDAGSGGGDTLRRIARWARGRGVMLHATGIDLNPHATRAAREAASPEFPIEWLTGDIFSYAEDREVDVIVSSLFTHHLPEEQIIRFLAWMERRARLGWFINDLERAAVPYHLFRALASAVRWHRFVRHDGPVSIRRAFRKEDWQRMCARAGLASAAYSIERFRPARLCVGRIR